MTHSGSSAGQPTQPARRIMFIDDVVEATVSVIREQSEVPGIVADRRREEKWFQQQIYDRLIQKKRPQTTLVAEKYYPEPNGADRCDLWYREDIGQESWVELKLCVKNFVSDYAYFPYNRSLPRQLDELIYDIGKLRRLPGTTYARHILLLAYPMPLDYRIHGRWPSYLAPIREGSSHMGEVLEEPVKRMGKTAHVVGYRIDV
jgi:hypothetical protein